jgi:glycosyltransferase involved in cell wall biosynthesis
MALDLARAQQRAGHVPSFLLLSESDYREDVRAAGLPVMAIVPSHAHLRSTWRAATALIRLAPDIVHCHGRRAMAVAACARCRGGHLAVVATTHGNPGWSGTSPFAPVGESLSRLLVRVAVDAVAGVNQELARADALSFPRMRVVEIVNGVDMGAFRPADSASRGHLKTALGFRADARLVVCTSRLTPLKGVDVLLNAWAEVHAARQDAVLAIVGDGNEREALEHRARERLGVSVRFLGSVRDVASVLRAADVFVFPSVRGCFGRSAIEALASGLPVIASRLDGTERFVTHGESAWLCAPGNGRELADAILCLLRDSALAERLRSAGRQLAEHRYSVDAMARAYEALYADARSHVSGWRSSPPR